MGPGAHGRAVWGGPQPGHAGPGTQSGRHKCAAQPGTHGSSPLHTPRCTRGWKALEVRPPPGAAPRSPASPAPPGALHPSPSRSRPPPAPCAKSHLTHWRGSAHLLSGAPKVTAGPDSSPGHLTGTSSLRDRKPTPPNLLPTPLPSRAQAPWPVGSSVLIPDARLQCGTPSVQGDPLPTVAVPGRTLGAAHCPPCFHLPPLPGLSGTTTHLSGLPTTQPGATPCSTELIAPPLPPGACPTTALRLAGVGGQLPPPLGLTRAIHPPCLAPGPSPCRVVARPARTRGTHARGPRPGPGVGPDAQRLVPVHPPHPCCGPCDMEVDTRVPGGAGTPAHACTKQTQQSPRHWESLLVPPPVRLSPSRSALCLNPGSALGVGVSSMDTGVGGWGGSWAHRPQATPSAMPAISSPPSFPPPL